MGEPRQQAGDQRLLPGQAVGALLAMLAGGGGASHPSIRKPNVLGRATRGRARAKRRAGSRAGPGTPALARAGARAPFQHRKTVQ